MLASELIKELQKIIDENGDAQVQSACYYEQYSGYRYWPVTKGSVEFDCSIIYIN